MNFLDVLLGLWWVDSNRLRLSSDSAGVDSSPSSARYCRYRPGSGVEIFEEEVTPVVTVSLLVPDDDRGDSDDDDVDDGMCRL